MSFANVEQSIADFEALLDSECNEQPVHVFLAEHPYFLLNAGRLVWLAVSKPNFGDDFQPDFALFSRGNMVQWIFVELKKPSDRLFNKNGDPSAKLTHAQRQTADWRRWLERNRAYCEETFGPFQIARTWIILGRRCNLTERDREHLAQINRDISQEDIMTPRLQNVA